MKWLIPCLYCLLAGVSVVTLKSIAPDLAIRQFCYFLVGGVILYFLSYHSQTLHPHLAFFFYWLVVILLIVLLIMGRSTRSTVRWIDLFMGFKIQPSQFVPLALALLFSSRPSLLNTDSVLSYIRLLGITFLPVGLVFFQPDFSTSVVILLSIFSVLILKPLSKKKTHYLFVGSLCMCLITWFFLLKPYQKNRVHSFLDAESVEQSAASYNARQALIAVGSGKIWGRGLGSGVQSHLRFLPERQTDFIFASMAEEWGLVGCLLILSVYAVLLIQIFVCIYRSNHLGNQSLLLILFCNFLIQIVINIGMNVGLFPITGLTLPLLSYGGSSILSFSIFLGFANQVILAQVPQFKLQIK